MQHHLHVWHSFLKRCERRRQHLQRGNRCVADVQLAIFAASQRADFFHRFISVLSNSRTSSRKSFPSAVSVTPRGLRRRRSTPISSSKSCTCRLKAGCATRSCAAALVKLKASPTARKYRRCRSSIAQSIMPQKHGSARNEVLGGLTMRG